VLTESLATGPVVTSRALTDSLVLADALARTSARARATNESLVLAEVVARTRTGSRGLSEALVLADAGVRQRASGRNLAEALVLADVATRATTTTRAPAEGLVLDDSLFTTGRTFTTGMTFGVPGTPSQSSMTETLVLSDVAFSQTGTGRLMVETLHVFDELLGPDILRVFTIPRTFTSGMVFGLAIEGTSGAAFDSFRLTDAVVRGGGSQVRTPGETLVLRDLYTGPGSATRVLVEQMVLSDVFSTPPVYSIFKGTARVSRIYLGTRPVLAIYRGTTRVF
jgi:hypothetical protein